MADENAWGWTSYRRTDWVQPDVGGGYWRLYKANFLRVSGPGVLASGRVVETVNILFWAHRPILALRSILQSGKNPASFHGKQVEVSVSFKTRGGGKR